MASRRYGADNFFEGSTWRRVTFEAQASPSAQSWRQTHGSSPQFLLVGPQQCSRDTGPGGRRPCCNASTLNAGGRQRRHPDEATRHALKGIDVVHLTRDRQPLRVGCAALRARRNGGRSSRWHHHGQATSQLPKDALVMLLPAGDRNFRKVVRLYCCFCQRVKIWARHGARARGRRRLCAPRRRGGGLDPSASICRSVRRPMCTRGPGVQVVGRGRPAHDAWRRPSPPV